MPKTPTELKEPLERVLVELCKRLPGNETLFEKNGFCQKPTDNCKYCEQFDKNNYLCKKQTYKPIAELNTI